MGRRRSRRQLLEVLYLEFDFANDQSLTYIQ